MGIFFASFANTDSLENSQNVKDYLLANKYRKLAILGSVIHFSSYPIYIGGAIWMANTHTTTGMPLVASIAGITYGVGPLVACISEKCVFPDNAPDNSFVRKSGFHYYGHSWIFLGSSAACFGLAALTANNDVLTRIFIGGGLCTILGSFFASGRSCIQSVKNISKIREEKMNKIALSVVPFYVKNGYGLVLSCRF
jgi:hypothetical protein